MVQESFEFVVYMIHACTNKWSRLPSFIVRDSEEFLNVRKVAV